MNLQLSAAGLVKYVWPFCYHSGIKGLRVQDSFCNFSAEILALGSPGYIGCPIIFSYDSYYVNKLSNITKDYSGLGTFFKAGELSVQAQSKHSVQTFHARTAGSYF